jgi:hypothetical protein
MYGCVDVYVCTDIQAHPGACPRHLGLSSFPCCGVACEGECCLLVLSSVASAPQWVQWVYRRSPVMGTSSLQDAIRGVVLGVPGKVGVGGSHVCPEA